MAKVVIRKPHEDEMVIGAIDNVLFLDSWAEGSINWQEIAEMYNTELGITPEPVSSELQKLMSEAIIDGCVVRFERKLERALYTMVDDALQCIGGKWDKKAKGHVFASDPTDLVEAIIESGTFERPPKEDNFGFFPTPAELVGELVKKAGITAGAKAIEPNAGDGAIAVPVAEIVGYGNVTTLELQEKNAVILRNKGFSPVVCDFLTYDSQERFDFVVMNPPFAKQQDIDHVMHAWKFLKPGGRLVSVMPASVLFRDNAKTRDFRAFVEANGGVFEENAEGAFRSSGTGVRTVTVVVDKPAIPVTSSVSENFWLEDETASV